MNPWHSQPSHLEDERKHKSSKLISSLRLRVCDGAACQEHARSDRQSNLAYSITIVRQRHLPQGESRLESASTDCKGWWRALPVISILATAHIYLYRCKSYKTSVRISSKLRFARLACLQCSQNIACILSESCHNIATVFFACYLQVHPSGQQAPMNCWSEQMPVAGLQAAASPPHWPK